MKRIRVLPEKNSAFYEWVVGGGFVAAGVTLGVILALLLEAVLHLEIGTIGYGLLAFAGVICVWAIQLSGRLRENNDAYWEGTATVGWISLITCVVTRLVAALVESLR